MPDDFSPNPERNELMCHLDAALTALEATARLVAADQVARDREAQARNLGQYAANLKSLIAQDWRRADASLGGERAA